MKRIVVIGAGAVGGCIAGLLTKAGRPVVVVARGDHGLAIKQEGLSVKFPNRTVHSSPECQSDITEVDWQDGDVAVIATKLNDYQQLLPELVKASGAKLPVVCASNGVQGELWAEQHFETVVSMLIWMPSVHLHPGDVRAYGEDCPGVLDVGPTKGSDADQVSLELSQWLTEAGFDSLHRPDIKNWKYAKWITNLGNAAQALVTDDWKSVAKAAQAEGELILEAAGIERIATKELLNRAAKIKLKPIDGERRPGGSTWQSFKRGKPLETEWLEGAMAKLANQFNVPAPVLYAIVSAAEAGRTVTAAEVLS